MLFEKLGTTSYTFFFRSMDLSCQGSGGDMNMEMIEVIFLRKSQESRILWS